jgi:hypothetical protein
VEPDPEYYYIKYLGKKVKVKVKSVNDGVDLICESMKLSTFTPNTTIKAIKGKI